MNSLTGISEFVDLKQYGCYRNLQNMTGHNWLGLGTFCTIFLWSLREKKPGPTPGLMR